MDPKERLNNLRETLIAVLQGWQADIWSAMPGIIQSVNLDQQTCVVQVAIQMSVRNIMTGETTQQAISPLLDCPLFFPHGGNCSITFPVAAGDECLVVFASRCIDGWWQNGGVQPQALFRMHDLSDGFAFAGFRSNSKVVGSISATTLQVRSADGNNVIELDPIGGNVNVKATTLIKLDAPIILTTGQIINQGGIVAEDGVDISGGVLMVGTHNFNTHEHTGVTTGGGTSGPVAP